MYRAINLTAADVAVLSALPALTTLSLHHSHHDDMAKDEWDVRLAPLRVACVARGRAPPAMVVWFRTFVGSQIFIVGMLKMERRRTIRARGPGLRVSNRVQQGSGAKVAHR